MNKFRLLALAAIVSFGTVFIQSCGPGDDPEPYPEVNFIGDAGFTALDASINGGTAFKIGVVATHTVKLTKLEIFVSYDGGPNLRPADCTVCDSSIDGTNLRAVYSGNTRLVAGTEKWTFRVTDKNNNSTSKSITITTTAGTGDNLIEISKDNDNNTLKVYNFKGPKAGAYDLKNGGNLLSGDPNADKDIQDSTRDEEVATWPARWGSRNGTMFKLVTAYTYAQVTNSSILADAWTSSGNAKEALTGIKSGDLIVAKLRGQDEYALILVTNVNSTPGDNNDYIEFKYKKKS